jgi:Pentapeptide repeats (8 copies)
LGIQRLWFVRKGGEVGGPYPIAIISRHYRLGRLKPDDEVSLDRLAWQQIREVGELCRESSHGKAPKHPVKREWLKEREAAGLRWIDERWHADRRERNDGAHLGDVEKRRAGDRRQHPESEAILELRRLHAETELWLSIKRVRYLRLLIAGILVVALLLAIALYLFPLRPMQVGLSQGKADCTAAPAPFVNWQGCDKTGANLGGANLRSADLRTAMLTRSNLHGADLSYGRLDGASLLDAILSAANLNSAVLAGANLSKARLDGSDLRYADLSGASIEGAVLDFAWLDHATWLDGRICAAESRGQCR